MNYHKTKISFVAPVLGLFLLALSPFVLARPMHTRPSVRINRDEMQCIVWAARNYHRPSDPISLQGYVDLLTAVRLAEGGQSGHISWNRNGSYDIGPMQINSIHLPQLQRFGISYKSLLTNACENIVVGAWILHANLGSSHDLWRAIGNYNSRTTVHNLAYQRRIWQHLQRVWSSKLTRGVLTGAASPTLAETSK